MTCALITFCVVLAVTLCVVLAACFVPIVLALDAREDDLRRKVYEDEREEFYARVRNERRER